jgi:hypothetical protein
MNAMSYVGAPGATTSRHWRIRHGSVDRDTSLAIPVILATKLTTIGKAVDFAIPWGVGHGGNYDLDELFAWMASVTSSQPRAQPPVYDASREGDIVHLTDTTHEVTVSVVTSVGNIAYAMTVKGQHILRFPFATSGRAPCPPARGRCYPRRRCQRATPSRPARRGTRASGSGRADSERPARTAHARYFSYHPKILFHPSAATNGR